MRKRSSSVSVLLFLTICVVESTHGQQRNDDSRALSSSSQITNASSADLTILAKEKIEAALQRPLALKYDETTWSEIEAELEKRFEINIQLTRSAMDDSLTADEPLSCSLVGLRLKDALRVLLSTKNASYVVRDGVVMIFSKDDEDAPQFMTHTFINVRPLLAKLKELEKDRIGQPRLQYRLPVVSVVPVVGSVERGLGSDGNQRKGGGVFSVDDKGRTVEPGKKTNAAPSPPSRQVELITAESLLIDLIHSSVEPNTWAKTGGGAPTCDIIGGHIVVLSSSGKADRLKEFLRELTKNVLKD